VVRALGSHCSCEIGSKVWFECPASNLSKPVIGAHVWCAIKVRIPEAKSTHKWYAITVRTSRNPRTFRAIVSRNLDARNHRGIPSMNSQDELRKRYRAWCRANERGDQQPLPDECHNLRCGAKTRSGTPCKRRDLYASGRCKLHGGLSTGPKSGPRAKRPEPPAAKPEPYDPANNSEVLAILRRQGIRC